MQEQYNTQCIEEDEIDLRELWQTILKGKKLIFGVTTVIVLLAFVFVLKQPNIYTSKAVLIPTESEGSSLGGLGGLAAMAGVSIGGGGSMSPDVAFNSLLGNYEFMRNFVIKNKIAQHYADPQLDQKYIFAFGFRGIYDLLHTTKENKEITEDEIYNIVNLVKQNLSISSDKKTSLISVSYSDADREYPPFVINAFLRDASDYLVKNNLDIIESKMEYFEKEMQKVDSYELKKSLSDMISKIVQEKVMTQSKLYYKSDLLAKPYVAYVKDKTKPKRGLILVVSFVTGLILSVFLVFFLEFLRKEKEESSE